VMVCKVRHTHTHTQQQQQQQSVPLSFSAFIIRLLEEEVEEVTAMGSGEVGLSETDFGLREFSSTQSTVRSVLSWSDLPTLLTLLTLPGVAGSGEVGRGGIAERLDSGVGESLTILWW
jgi:hypothetical protein